MFPWGEKFFSFMVDLFSEGAMCATNRKSQNCLPCKNGGKSTKCIKTPYTNNRKKRSYLFPLNITIKVTFSHHEFQFPILTFFPVRYNGNLKYSGSYHNRRWWQKKNFRTIVFLSGLTQSRLACTLSSLVKVLLYVDLICSI